MHGYGSTHRFVLPGQERNPEQAPKEPFPVEPASGMWNTDTGFNNFRETNVLRAKKRKTLQGPRTFVSGRNITLRGLPLY